MAREYLLGLLIVLGGCELFERPNCAKVYCGADQICFVDYTQPEDSASPVGTIPECTDPPASCGDNPTCDCLPDCTRCEVDNGLVRCTIE